MPNNVLDACLMFIVKQLVLQWLMFQDNMPDNVLDALDKVK
jgi:hypothetical protein